MDINSENFYENSSIKTIFSDCFRNYQPSNFNNYGYIIKI